MTSINVLLANEIQDMSALKCRFYCGLHVLVRKLANPFGHPTHVSKQVQLAATCDYLRLAFSQGFILEGPPPSSATELKALLIFLAASHFLSSLSSLQNRRNFWVFLVNRGESKESAKRELRERRGALNNPACPHTIVQALPTPDTS